jgi:hypothetical protein
MSLEMQKPPGICHDGLSISTSLGPGPVLLYREEIIDLHTNLQARGVLAKARRQLLTARDYVV